MKRPITRKFIYSGCIWEKLAVAACLENGTLPVAALRKQVEKVNALVEKKPIDYTRLVEADLGFHEFIIQAAGNRRVANIWDGLKNQLKTLLFLYFNTTKSEPSLQDYASHGKVVDALESGGPKKDRYLAGVAYPFGHENASQYLKPQFGREPAHVISSTVDG